MKDIKEALVAYDLGPKECALLSSLQTVVESGMDDVLDSFYGFAMDHQDIKAFFPNDQILSHARGRQKEHWLMLLNGDFSEAYLQSAQTVGEVHFRIQLPFRFYMAGYARAASDLAKLVAGRLRRTSLTSSKLATVVQATSVLKRAMFLDAELVIQSYFQAQSTEQTLALSIIEDGLAAIANGSGASEIRSERDGGTFPARYDALRESFNRAIEALSTMNSELMPMVEGLGLSAHEVSSAVEALATRTEEQAHALAETAGSVHDLRDSVSTSAQNAAQVDEQAQTATGSAREAGEVVGLAIEAMNSIEASSNRIAERISSINEIAFQTNLLALNAAVEAAQAGEAGRGFAIVAGEVRALAERASQTATEVDQIIQESAKSVSSGVERVGRTGEALEDIISTISNVGELITQMTHNTQAQSQKLGGISEALDQLDRVTQANVSMVEETTAAAIDLGNTHEEIRTTLGRLVSENASADPRRAA